DVIPIDPGIGAGRTTHVSGRAVQATAEKAVEELRGWAAELRGWPESEIELVEGEFRLRRTQNTEHRTQNLDGPVRLDEAASEAIRRKGEPLEIRGQYSG